eukprot:tig00021464_g21713.t1
MFCTAAVVAWPEHARSFGTQPVAARAQSLAGTALLARATGRKGNESLRRFRFRVAPEFQLRQEAGLSVERFSQSLRRRFLRVLATSLPPTSSASTAQSSPDSVSPAKPAAAPAPAAPTTSRKPAPLTICVFGASGDLAAKKIFPALFALYYQGQLPEDVSIFGYARTNMTDEEFREKITERLSCRLDFTTDCGDKMDKFLDQCYYFSGGYGDEDAMRGLSKKMAMHEAPDANRVFYMSLPPSAFISTAKGIKAGAMSPKGWTRVIVEKPFGRDSESSKALSDGLAASLEEDQIYRIDHYLAKELVQNILVMRFANLIFEPVWNNHHIESVQIIFKEDFGTEGRGGYFDQYGIIRDIIQNHLLQILTLIAMEQPVSLESEDVRNEKVKVLRCIKPIDIQDTVIGQYTGKKGSAGKVPGYKDDATVAPDSITPTFAAMAMYVRNRRWDGVPFLIKAGKALDERLTEVRIKFRHVPGNLFGKSYSVEIPRNELVIRVQPDERIKLRILSKVPGLKLKYEETDLDLSFKSRFQVDEIPDAYERLILDVCKGDRSLFIRSDELQAAWDIFTPVLNLMEEEQIVPRDYPFGSTGPAEAAYLAAKHDTAWAD